MIVAFFKSLFSATGDVSAMRFMSVSAVYMAGGIAAVGIYLKLDPYAIAALCSAFLVPAFTGKAMQSKFEASDNNQSKGEIK